jgi:hypothetical protein
MGGLYNRIKTWILAETITHTDLNAEFDRVKDSFEPQYMDDISADTAAFQSVQDPGDVGTENLPLNLKEELESLRSMIKKITGEAQWYVPPDTSISFIADAFGSNLSGNRIDSGAIDANSQPQVLVPDGTTLALAIEGTPTNLLYTVQETQYTKSTDGTKTLSAGFSANHTATVNDLSTLFASMETKTLGEVGNPYILLASVGSEISGRAGKLCAFSTTNGGDTEYFIGRVSAAGTVL